MNDLVTRINELSREQAFEAARYLSASLGASVEKIEKERAALLPLTEQPYANVADIEALARLFLLSAATEPEYQPKVEKAIEGAGLKQFILGGGEIVVISTLALYALQVVITKGKAQTDEVVKITEEDGKKTVEIHKTVRYGVGSKLADILGGYFGLKK